ncbi:MAG: hypothetical protein K6F70_00645 [Eggerthellaceae bacterium]|nr:hypothetical protein [Eggerthellaceae bacterium]
MKKVDSVQDLSKEQQHRFVKIDSKEELMKFLQDEEIELTDEQLDGVSGGSKYWDDARSCASSGK